MRDTWMDRLSEYLDSEMERSEREALEAHLAECRECAAVLADLKKVRARARDRAELPVPGGIWSGIERSIAQGGSSPRVVSVTRPGLSGRARFSYSLPQLLAACLVVAIVSGGAVFAVLGHSPAPTVTPPVRMSQAPEGSGAANPRNRETETSTSDAPNTVMAERPAPRTTMEAMPAARNAESASNPALETPKEEAISELRQALASKRDKLDPATIRTLESNLAIIDLAIDQARRALVADSANTYVKEHLADTMRRRVELLQRATMLASTSGPEENR